MVNINYVIFLNGSSSVGKTSIAKAIQKIAQIPFMLIGIDNIIEMMPEKLNKWKGGFAEEGFWWKKSLDKDKQVIYELQAGPFAQKISNTFQELVKCLICQNHNVIVDEVALDKNHMNIWRNQLSNFNVLYIKLVAPLEILEARERARGNRMIGSARAFYYKEDKTNFYDLEIDTGDYSSYDLAAIILNELAKKFKI